MLPNFRGELEVLVSRRLIHCLLELVYNLQQLPEEQNVFPASQFELSIRPFRNLLPVLLKSNPSSSDLNFGFTFKDADLLKRAFVNTIKPKYTDSKIFSNPISTKNKPRGAFVDSINDTYAFTSSDVLKRICILNDQEML